MDRAIETCGTLSSIPMFVDWKTYIVNMAILPKLIYRFSEIPIKPHLAFL